jgi:hypothetical protein
MSSSSSISCGKIETNDAILGGSVEFFFFFFFFLESGFVLLRGL